MTEKNKESGKYRNREVPIKMIREIRDVSGLSNRDIAACIGLSHVQIYDIERGKYNPHLSTREKLGRLHQKIINACGRCEL